jgi:hypothetical protein
MQREYLALADKSLATDVVSGSSDIVEPSEDPTPDSDPGGVGDARPREPGYNNVDLLTRAD